MPEMLSPTFKELIQEARTVEASILVHRKPEAKRDEAKIKRCTICHRKGHDTKDCRRKSKPEKEDNNTTAERKPTIHCYGCNRPGYIRMECPDCSKKPTEQEGEASFCAIEVAPKPRERPTVKIEILGETGQAVLDTGARSSIGSHQLQELLSSKGVRFQKTRLNVTLADGSRTCQTVDITTLPIA